MATKKGNGKLDAKSFDTVSIPPFAGSTPVTGRYQRRTQIQYAILTTIGLLGFYNSKNSRVRVAGLSCLFPGAGFLAVGGFLGAIGLVLSVAVLPLSIFAWFGAGGLAFVLANWIVPAIISTSIAGDSVWEPAGPIVIVFVIALVIYMLRSGAARHATALKLRQSRNELLDKEEVAWQARAQPIPSPSEKRELSLEELRMLQHFIQVAHQAMDDWSNYSHVDQFQTAAFRYQLYGLQWLLALVQKYWMPSFHGYLKEGQEKTIDKSTTQDVMNYWKWESLWGKFTLDWDPAKRDNIMVTGYILLSVALYEKLTGDERYSTKDSLNFRITKGAQYTHNAESIFESLMENWDSCSYCLFPCEPNWIYTICNLVGIQGALAYEAIKHTGRVEPLLAGRYHRSFEEDFMNADGSVVALRSAITGFPMVGLTGVIGDVGAAGSCGAAMPNLARRLWLVSREAHIRKDARGKYTVDNLLGADKIDVGNYKKGAGYAFSLFAQCAAEFGEEELANDLLNQLEEHMHPTVASPSGNGAVVANGLSMIGCLNVFRARVCKRGDWENLILSGPDTAALAAPKLDAVPFPQVMVARCHPEGETGVSFVLRGPTDKKTVGLGFKDLRNGAEYRLLEIGEGGKRTEVVGGIRSDGQGRTQVRVAVGDRSEFELRPVA